MKHSLELTGKVALVTGGRRGLGLAMALGLAEAGARVAVAARAADAEELAAGMDHLGAEWYYVSADLAERNQRQKLIPQIVEHFGQLDILVTCAGIQHREPATEFALETWDQMTSLMLTGVFEICQQAARVMAHQGGGKIINIGSICGFQGGWTIPAYVAAKHGVHGLTKALANEWAAKHINVNCIAPGYFDTELCAGIKGTEREEKILERVPAGRWGQPEELVGPLLFLASNASNFMHGTTLTVDGGWMGH